MGTSLISASDGLPPILLEQSISAVGGRRGVAAGAVRTLDGRADRPRTKMPGAHGSGNMLGMRELVYLSDNKLRQFIEDEPRRRWWPGGGKATIKLPVVSVELEAASSQKNSQSQLGKQLGTVASHLELSARWYEDPQVSAGGWITFDVPMIVVEHGPGVLFFDPVDVRNPMRTRLLLHGSSASLLPRTSVWAETVDPESIDPRKMSAPSFVYELEAMVRSMRLEAAGQDPKPKELDDPNQRLRQSVSSVICTLDRNLSPVIAAWVTGLARVSAVFPEQDAWIEYLTDSGSEVDFVAECGSEVGGSIVVASPLYVERVEPPGE
jgi:hypothetical protein